MGEVCEIKGGKRLPKGEELTDQKGSHPYLKVADMTSDKYVVLNNKIQYVHQIDNVMFSHGGVSERFVRNLVSKERFHDTDYVLDTINHLGYREMWRNSSPIWVRPQFNIQYMYMYESFLQVVGHTPVEDISVCENVVSTDVFSTYRNGTPIGSQRFAVVDTITFEVSSCETLGT